MNDQKIIHIDPSAQRQILENQEAMLNALYRLMQSTTDRVINDQEWRRDMRRLADEYHHTRKILGKDYIDR